MGRAAPRTERHTTSFRSRSGARSASVKSIRADSSAPHAVGAFFSSSGTPARPVRVGTEVRLRRERRGHRRRRGVALAHRRQTEDELDRAKHPAGRVERRVHGAAPRVRARDERDGSVRVHVVRPVLRVVLEDEDRGLLPVSGSSRSLRRVVRGRGRSRRSSRAASGNPAFVPDVWSLPSRRIESAGSSPFFSKPRNSSSQTSTRRLSGIERSNSRDRSGQTRPARPGTDAARDAFFSFSRSRRTRRSSAPRRRRARRRPRGIRTAAP